MGFRFKPPESKGVFLYGPYIALPAGDYQIKLHGKIKRTGVGNLKLEATIDFGNKVLAARALDASRIDGLIVHMAVSIPTAVNTFEVRLWVLADCEICIDKLEIVLLEGVATFGSEKNLLAFHRPFEGDNSLHTPEPKNTLNNCLQEILQEDEEEFVNAAFHALLRRRPDANGGRAYLRALRSGTSRIQILYDLLVAHGMSKLNQIDNRHRQPTDLCCL